MKRGHTHKWRMVWNNATAYLPYWTRAVYKCQVKRCGEMGYSC